MIRKLVIENGKLHHLCMKFNKEEKLNSLVLENCYYCILYNLDLCTFNYKLTDNIGHIFYYYKNDTNKLSEFYIKNINDVNNPTNKLQKSYDKLIKSYNNDIVDFSLELDSISVNSTISEEYGVRNIIYDNLDYWSSKLYFKPNCQSILVEVKNLLNIFLYLDTIKSRNYS